MMNGAINKWEYLGISEHDFCSQVRTGALLFRPYLSVFYTCMVSVCLERLPQHRGRTDGVRVRRRNHVVSEMWDRDQNPKTGCLRNIHNWLVPFFCPCSSQTPVKSSVIIQKLHF